MKEQLLEIRAVLFYPKKSIKIVGINLNCYFYEFI